VDKKSHTQHAQSDTKVTVKRRICLFCGPILQINMSKKRPSTPSTKGPLNKGEVGYWRARLFQNTFTREGRKFTVDKWSVKIQHRGRRRTFSLRAMNRAEAAVEARQLYLKLLKDGWEGLEHDDGLGRDDNGAKFVAERSGANKLSVEYWRQALIVRSGTSPAAGSSKGRWSAWLDHEGAGYYFPLRPASAQWAAKEALEIYQKVRAVGWAAVFKLHPREVTVAFHWTHNPLAWTYTTFSTLLRRERSGPRSEPVWQVVVVESERELRHALEFYVNLHPGFACVATFASVEVARVWVSMGRPDLVLVNENLPDGGGAKALSELKRAAPRALGMLFSVYADSGQLFKCSPGGALGYLFKRTPPERMLEPLLNASTRPSSPPEQYLSAVALSYFQQVLSRLELKPSSSRLAGLTPRESQILEYLSKGFPDKEIAGAVGISAWTVHGHLKSIFEKLQVHNRLEAVLKYLNK
jgi:DNA-binding NarL/FixJ family response regulator